jgi:hypothetical protein
MSTARRNALQLVHYLRFTVNFNDPGIAGAGGAPKQTLPKGAILIGTDVNVVTPFNAATTNVLIVGSQTAGAINSDVVAAADVTETAAGLTQNIKPTGNMLVPLANDTQIFAQFTQTGTAATAGKAIVIVKYIPDNDL